MPIVILAHGALGIFDEIIFVSIAIIFIGIMVVSWFRSQQLPDEGADETSGGQFISREQLDPGRFELD